jgi:hypothetical protein
LVGKLHRVHMSVVGAGHWPGLEAAIGALPGPSLGGLPVHGMADRLRAQIVIIERRCQSRYLKALPQLGSIRQRIQDHGSEGGVCRLGQVTLLSHRGTLFVDLGRAFALILFRDRVAEIILILFSLRLRRLAPHTSQSLLNFDLRRVGALRLLH